MQTEPVIALVDRDPETPGLEMRVNFGIFAGREATAAEIDEFARALVPEVGEVSIVSEQRHEIGEDVEASLHQVRVEIASDQLPSGEERLDRLSERLVELAEGWTLACVADRHAEIDEF